MKFKFRDDEGNIHHLTPTEDKKFSEVVMDVIYAGLIVLVVAIIIL